MKDGLELADLLYGRERDAGVRVYYSKRLKPALESGKWSLKLPHTVLHRWNSEEHGLYGDVYVLTSPERHGQFKVGATTIPLDKRVYIYQRRYFTKVSVYENFFCKDPFGIEKNFMDYSPFKRVAGNVYDDSNEWFYGEAKKACKLLDNLISNR